MEIFPGCQLWTADRFSNCKHSFTVKGRKKWRKQHDAASFSWPTHGDCVIGSSRIPNTRRIFFPWPRKKGGMMNRREKRTWLNFPHWKSSGEPSVDRSKSTWARFCQQMSARGSKWLSGEIRRKRTLLGSPFELLMFSVLSCLRSQSALNNITC